MTTTVDVDEALMRETLKFTGLTSAREAVEAGLRTLMQRHAQAELLKLRGKIEWEGDLDDMRTDKSRPTYELSAERLELLERLFSERQQSGSTG